MSVGSGGMAGGGSNPVVSPDGRFVAFVGSRGILPRSVSDATNSGKLIAAGMRFTGLQIRTR